jgi:stage II sporulation protein P
MRVRRSDGIMISLQGTSIMKGIVGFFVGIITIFIVTGLLTSLKPEYRIASSSLNQWADNFSGKSLIFLLGYENTYFTQAVPEEVQKPKYTQLAFEMATSINPDDPRSLLGREIPGYSLYDGKILVAGEGTNYTNMPYESYPPMEVMLQERQASEEAIEKAEQEAEKAKETNPTTDGKKVVYIYYTHTRESYLPMLKNVTEPDEAYHAEANITLVGDRLKNELEKRGIGTISDKTDITDILFEKGLSFSDSYEASRPVVSAQLEKNPNLKYLIDIHRDSRPKKETTVTINGKAFARTVFVVGGEHAQYEKNLKVANELHDILEKKYPGLSRGVVTKQGKGMDGKYNQDLSGNAMLIEFGGVGNTLEELNRTAEAFAEVFSAFYWKAEKVNN